MHSERCPVCKGKGKVEAKQCHGCGGKGWITVGDPVDVRPIFYPVAPLRFPVEWEVADPQIIEWYVAGIDNVSHPYCTEVRFGTKTTVPPVQEIPIEWPASNAV